MPNSKQTLTVNDVRQTWRLLDGFFKRLETTVEAGKQGEEIKKLLAPLVGNAMRSAPQVTKRAKPVARTATKAVAKGKKSRSADMTTDELGQAILKTLPLEGHGDGMKRSAIADALGQQLHRVDYVLKVLRTGKQIRMKGDKAGTHYFRIGN